MKKSLIRIITVVIIVTVVILSYFNFVKPVRVKKMNVLCQNWDATYEGIKAFAEMYNEGNYNKNTTIVHGFDGKLPSDNPKDYMSVYINFEMENRCCFQPYLIDGYISGIENNSDMAMYSGSIADAENARVYRMNEKECGLVMDIYIRNRTDDEIKELIRGLTVALSCKGEIIGQEKINVKLASLNDITIER